MSRTRLHQARGIVRFEPSKEMFKAELPAIYGYAPHILSQLMDDIKLDTPKIIYGYQEYFVATRTEINQNIICAINYKLIKPGDIVEINSPSFAKHGKKLCVQHKSNLTVSGLLVDEPNCKVKISANSVIFLPPVPSSDIKNLREKFKLDSLCLISSDNYRPRYELGDVFRIVSAGSKYVRVEPTEPRFPLWKRKTNRKERKINSFTYEKGVKGEREFYYSSSVYNMDIPYHDLKEVQEVFGEEIGNMICDFTELGL